MDINRLEEFIVIAQEQSIKKAAARLGLAPATLSSRLSTFERDLESPLFERERSSLQLTEAGMHLLHHATEITGSYHQLVEQMQMVSSNTLHSLRVGIIGSKIPFHIGPYLDVVNHRNPHIQIDLLDESDFSIPESLLNGEIDLCIGPVMNSFHHDALIRQSIASPNANVLMPISHPLAQSEVLSIHQLEKNTFILSSKSRSPLVREFQLTNLKESLHSYSLYDSDTSIAFLNNLVPVGKGLLITPFYDPTYLPNVILRPLTDLPHPAPDSLLYLRNPYRRELKTFLYDFTEFIKENTSNDHRTTL